MAKKFDEQAGAFTEEARASMYDFSYEPSLIFQADERWTYGREPVMRRMADGSLVCLIYSGGNREPSPENCVLITRSKDDGASWSKPEVLFDHGQRCVWSTELFTECGKPMIFVNTFLFDTHYFELKTYCSMSDDCGRSWTEPQSVRGVCANAVVRKGITLNSGDKLLPVYWTELLNGFNWDKKAEEVAKTGAPAMFSEGVKWRFVSGVWRSEDNGQTWQQHGYVPVPDDSGSWGAWEPGIVQLSDGKLAMLIRVNGTGCLWRSDSSDDGRTWSQAYKTDIPNPGTKFDILKINGKIVLLNNSDHEVRNPLTLWVSDNDMASWGKKLELIRSKQFGKWICYPHAIADDGKQLLYIASDAVKEFYLQKVPYSDFLG